MAGGDGCSDFLGDGQLVVPSCGVARASAFGRAQGQDRSETLQPNLWEHLLTKEPQGGNIDRNQRHARFEHAEEVNLVV